MLLFTSSGEHTRLWYYSLQRFIWNGIWNVAFFCFQAVFYSVYSLSPPICFRIPLLEWQQVPHSPLWKYLPTQPTNQLWFELFGASRIALTAYKKSQAAPDPGGCYTAIQVTAGPWSGPVFLFCSVITGIHSQSLHPVSLAGVCSCYSFVPRLSHLWITFVPQGHLGITYFSG